MIRVGSQMLIVVMLLHTLVYCQDSFTKDPGQIERELSNQSSLYLKEMEDLFKNESKVLFKEHIENFRYEMENEIVDVEKFIIKEYNTMINAINNTGGTTRSLVNDTKTELLQKLLSAKQNAIQSYQEIKEKFHNIVDKIENNVENHHFGERVFLYLKHAFHKIATVVRLSKKDPNVSGDADDMDDEQREKEMLQQEQIMQQMPVANYFPQLSNMGL